MQQKLLSLRQTLELACQDLDEQIAALGSEPPPAPVKPAKVSTKPKPSQAHLDAAAEFTRRLFEADPKPVSPEPERLAFEERKEAVAQRHPTSVRVIEAIPEVDLDPTLEQATLEELNTALSAAFEQIAKNRIW
ncbi:hypothetical protein [Brevifollis gellanilyticus]|uniref:Uncharacterized protein n=1 Tax=Brevifollis gellanilyticus TaxID=748831 RepID=A0A512M3H9_9BACT|nr:hypothetical protein [Brevifollis gellanilyticus]GEP40871.1 hypothetical protein BGE01nite_01620 [Brevifollis gellanilyticus]